MEFSRWKETINAGYAERCTRMICKRCDNTIIQGKKHIPYQHLHEDGKWYLDSEYPCLEVNA